MKRRLPFILLAALTTYLPPQAGAFDYDHNASAWYNYFGDHAIGDGQWGLHLDAQVRRDNLGLDQQQYLVQPGVNFKARPNLDLGAGYGYMRTYPYGDFPLPAPLDEHRVWEQVSTTTPALGLNWNHRLRLEQRHIGRAGSFRYENRVSYRLLTTLPLPFVEDPRYYLKASEEIFVNFGGAVAKNHFDQNRAYLAVGRRLSEHTKLEIGFMEQTLQHRDGRVLENNHTLMVSFFSGWPFGGDAKKAR
jgi:hypothetical protein